jgi:hypothetical protein
MGTDCARVTELLATCQQQLGTTGWPTIASAIFSGVAILVSLWAAWKSNAIALKSVKSAEASGDSGQTGT